MNLKPIKPKRISDQVFEQIRELIYKGEFKPGEQILPERELAQSMAVSRTSVRNAINKLVTLGLLEHRQGQGTFVSTPENREGNPLAAAMATDEATFEDLLEVRFGLECNAAMLAAKRANESDIKAIRKSLDEMIEALDSHDKISTAADAAFHMAVAFATKNPVLIHLMRNFYDFLFVGIKKNLARMYLDQTALDAVIGHHEEIYSSIERREPESAFAAMRNHINYVQEYYQDR